MTGFWNLFFQFLERFIPSDIEDTDRVISLERWTMIVSKRVSRDDSLSSTELSMRIFDVVIKA